MDFIKNFLNKTKKYEFEFNENGKHQLGGEIPDEFIIPENEFKSNFQYLGYINNDDEVFNWLPFKLNLICPIYLDIDLIFLDYEKPNEPKLIYPKNTSEIGSAYTTLDINSRVIYEAQNFSLIEFDGVTEDNEFDIKGIAGKPHWDQKQNIPKCPKTNNKMKFVCQLTSWNDVPTKYTNVVADNDYEQNLFSKMNFWDDGSLYVFIEPEAKTVCCFIQNT
ncbi:hypothetical protein [Flavobacterium sp. YJ01]|uniref:hypothetical protein n=1 Tax=unclassified Flavobacterium TaxID=196869 RepID=UPI0023E36B75|nr:hypothetical protein [Flavobacterium sp. YJ01]WET03221.1 hypothetical protein P0R33_02575 [Flavobacterium sp. YJ01]